MRIAVLTGLFACTLIFSVGDSKVSASAAERAISIDNEIEQTIQPASVVKLLAFETDVALQVLQSSEVPTPEPVKQPVTHVVAENDSLSKIAEAHQTTWKRLYDKNTNLENPDILAVGFVVQIPEPEEQVAERPLPVVTPVEPVVSAPATARATKKAAPKTASSAPKTSAPQVRGASSGNGYVAGYCTWYVKNKRPDLPNNLGNAATWVSRAAAQGMPTGATPAVGAVGQRGNHVVYVESVNSDGTVTISEMNHKGLYVTTTRTLPASYFSYIY